MSEKLIKRLILVAVLVTPLAATAADIARGHVFHTLGENHIGPFSQGEFIGCAARLWNGEKSQLLFEKYKHRQLPNYQALVLRA